MALAKAGRTLIEIEGCNGDWVTISGPGMGAEGCFLGTDVEGIYDAPVKTIYTEYAEQVGATFEGFRNLKRDIVFGCWIGNTESDTWQANDSRWRKLWSYTKETRMWVTTEESGTRYLKLRMSEQPNFKPEHDPNLKRVEKVVMTCVAADPWWYEKDDYTAQFVSTGASSSGFVKVSNPTDQEIWLKWVLQGAARWVVPDWSFGDNRYKRATADATRAISMPLQAAGQTFLVDTDPFEEQLRDENGAQVWSWMNGVSFNYPLPPYLPETNLPVSVSQASAGVGIQVRCPRNWSRPWGLE